MGESALAQAEAIPSLFAEDADLLRRAGDFRCALLLQVGDVPFHAELADGALVLTRGPLLMRSWSFAVRGDAAAWSGFWRPQPAPGFHDLFALAKAQRLVIEGDLYPFVSRLLFWKDLLALPRRIGAPA